MMPNNLSSICHDLTSDARFHVHLLIRLNFSMYCSSTTKGGRSVRHVNHNADSSECYNTNMGRELTMKATLRADPHNCLNRVNLL